MGHAIVNHSVFIDECGYTIFGLLEAKAEREEEKGPTGKSVVKEEET